MSRALRRPVLAGPAAVVGAAVVVFVVLFATSPAARGSTTVVSTDPAVIAAGQVLYEQHCQACHGYEGQGGVVKGAPELVDRGAAAADFYLTTGRMPLNAPNNEALRHHPSFSAQQISDLVSYIANLPNVVPGASPGPGIPSVLPLCPDQTAPSSSNSCVTLSEGEQLYAINCAQCHQAAGAGGMLSKGNVVPSLHNANIIQAAEAPIVGPKPMPKFNFTPQQQSAVAQYVEYLQHPDDPGGAGIGHFGPVVEGFFAIGVGFVLLWFASRMIGNRG
jgi:ubiquinol-cytochrome c reductase cytochrome c subunit